MAKITKRGYQDLMGEQFDKHCKLVEIMGDAIADGKLKSGCYYVYGVAHNYHYQKYLNVFIKYNTTRNNRYKLWDFSYNYKCMIEETDKLVKLLDSVGVTV